MFESTKWALEEMSNLAENNKFNVLFPTVFKPPKNRSGPNQNLSEDPQIGNYFSLILFCVAGLILGVF